MALKSLKTMFAFPALSRTLPIHFIRGAHSVAATRRWDSCESVNWLSLLLTRAPLILQARLASGVTAPLAAEAVFAVVLAALPVRIGLVYQTRNSSESAISHNLSFGLVQSRVAASSGAWGRQYSNKQRNHRQILWI